MMALHIARRKLATFATTVRACSNWPAITRAKFDSSSTINALQFRSGLQLRPLAPLNATWSEVFEPAIADVYGVRNSSADLIVDVGANIGAFSCLAAHTHPSAVVHAFEPSSKHADLLEVNVTLNHLPNVILHRQAVTKDGREVIFSDLGTGGASGIFLHEGGRSTALQSISLDCVDLSAARSLFVKLDCEGAEGEIIEWLCESLSKLPPQITLACEYHHWCPRPLEQLLETLRSHGFRAEHRTPFDESYIFAFRREGSPGSTL